MSAEVCLTLKMYPTQVASNPNQCEAKRGDETVLCMDVTNTCPNVKLFLTHATVRRVFLTAGGLPW